MMTRLLGALVFLVQLLAAAEAHELRPAFLDMKATAADRFSVVWKLPVLGQKQLQVKLRLPETCGEDEPPLAAEEGNYVINRWSVTCDGGLRGGTIYIDGLRTTLTDVLVRIEYADSTTEVTRLTPEKISFEVTGQMNWLETAATYFRLGVDHILSGVDHLLFVLALMLLIREPWMLLKTITAFTVAHSMTLAGASLGYFSLPQKPVEATIALSIAFVASELVKSKAGDRRLSEAYPWLVAFTFGLLHGFGFAGALKEVGLPQTDVPVALLTFNLGVEAGQLLFVAAILVIYKAISAFLAIPIRPFRLTAAYLIGTTAMIWLVARIGTFVS